MTLVLWLLSYVQFTFGTYNVFNRIIILFIFRGTIKISFWFPNVSLRDVKEFNVMSIPVHRHPVVGSICVTMSCN